MFKHFLIQKINKTISVVIRFELREYIKENNKVKRIKIIKLKNKNIVDTRLKKDIFSN